MTMIIYRFLNGIYIQREILNNISSKHTDHINGNRLDNRKCNLRLCEVTQNLRNKKKSANKSSKYKGVQWDKRAEKWRGRIKTEKDVHLGFFNSEIDAAIKHNEVALIYFGEFAKLNQISDEKSLSDNPTHHPAP